MGVADDDLFTPGDDQTFRFPLAEDAADGEQGCAGHFSQILAGDGKIDQNPLLSFFASFGSQAFEPFDQE